jgi:glycyl-tRNA synthetase
MFKTFQGVTEDSKAELYLRPETAQGIFVNFKQCSADNPPQDPVWHLPDRQVVPQRNHPGQFHLPDREFEQMELEFFCEPGTDLEWFAYWRNFC